MEKEANHHPTNVNITPDQTFSFDFKVILPSQTTPVNVLAEMQWGGQIWKTKVEPKTRHSINPELVEQIAEIAEQVGEKMMREAGYNVPDPTPTKVEINIPTRSMTPEEQLQLVDPKKNHSQIQAGEPTNYIQFQDGVLMQLWRGTTQTWEKGQKPTSTPWEGWFPVAGQ